MASGAPSKFRKVLEYRLAEVAGELESRFEAEAGARAAAARRSVSEQLNQAVRQLRNAEDFAAVAAVLLDAGAAFCNGAAVFRVTADKELSGERVRGADEDRSARFGELRFPARQGAVFAAVLEGGDPLVTMSSTGEIAPEVVALLAHAPEERIALFPIVAGGKPAGLLYAWGEPQMAALELLAQAAGLVLPAQPSQVKPAELVGIEPAAPAPVPPADKGWSAMAPTVRDAHLRAQRFARVQVAELRLYRPENVAAGRARRDLYGALRDSIDAARETFRRQFLVPTPGMADYFHEELLRTLAGNEAALLGPEYPGPLA